VRKGILVGLAVVAGLIGSSACGGPSPDQGIDDGLGKDAFIAAYVDLRLAALRNGGTIDMRLRETVLSNHGVTEDDLLAFAEAHGRDVSFMSEVWQEVERRLDSIHADGSPEG